MATVPAGRLAVSNSPLTRFRAEEVRQDLLNPQIVNTWLVDFCQYLLKHNIAIEFLYFKTGHHNDGPGRSHWAGRAMDVWFINLSDVGPYYIDATDPRFQQILRICAAYPHLGQIGLGGSADNPANVQAAGPTYFPDSDQDHVHLSCAVIP